MPIFVQMKELNVFNTLMKTEDLELVTAVQRVLYLYILSPTQNKTKQNTEVNFYLYCHYFGQYVGVSFFILHIE